MRWGKVIVCSWLRFTRLLILLWLGLSLLEMAQQNTAWNLANTRRLCLTPQKSSICFAIETWSGSICVAFACQTRGCGNDVSRTSFFFVLYFERKKAELMADRCAICLADLEDDQRKLLACTHVFHGDCIRSWFESDHNTCPICRHVCHDKPPRSARLMRPYHYELMRPYHYDPRGRFVPIERLAAHANDGVALHSPDLHRATG